jgi:hypothetical protein
MKFDRGGAGWVIFILACILALVFLVSSLVSQAHARDLGQWEGGDPSVREWYQTLMQPDNPTVSCCGEADAYWCDAIHVRDGKTFCTITDDRPNEPLHRPPVAIGTEIEIPDRKLKWDRGNPTGHAIVFLSSGGAVYCFVQNGGV